MYRCDRRAALSHFCVVDHSTIEVLRGLGASGIVSKRSMLWAGNPKARIHTESLKLIFGAEPLIGTARAGDLLQRREVGVVDWLEVRGFALRDFPNAAVSVRGH